MVDDHLVSNHIHLCFSPCLISWLFCCCVSILVSYFPLLVQLCRTSFTYLSPSLEKTLTKQLSPEENGFKKILKKRIAVDAKLFDQVCAEILQSGNEKYLQKGCHLLQYLEQWNPRNWTLDQPIFRSDPVKITGKKPIQKIPIRLEEPLLFYPHMKQEPPPDADLLTRRVCFYKLYKVGGSTFMSILHRMSWFHGLWTAYLPEKGFSVSSFVKKAVPNISHFDLFPLHFFFSKQNQALLHSLVPNCEDVTILRDPVARFISNFYYNSPPEDKTVEKLEAELDIIKSESLSKKPVDRSVKTSVFNGISYGLTNRIDSQYIMSLEFNMTLELLQGTSPQDFVYNSVKRKPFKHVIILEYFDEGLVMLMRDFHWSFYDIAYQVMKKNKGFPLPSKEHLVFLKQSHKLDYVLYDAAVETFRRNLDSQGEDFSEDLRTFQAFNHILSEYCSLESVLNRLGSFCLEISLDQHPWMRAHRIPSYGMR